jgi:hypothetical protein
MRKSGMVLLVGGLVLGATGAMAQQLASAVPQPKGEFVVFAEKGSHALSPTALVTVRMAASEASSAHRVTLVGRPENVASVKGALERNGVPADAIVVRSEPRAPIAKAADGLSDPTERRVEIKF